MVCLTTRDTAPKSGRRLAVAKANPFAKMKGKGKKGPPKPNPFAKGAAKPNPFAKAPPFAKGGKV